MKNEPLACRKDAREGGNKLKRKHVHAWASEPFSYRTIDRREVKFVKPCHESKQGKFSSGDVAEVRWESNGVEKRPVLN